MANSAYKGLEIKVAADTTDAAQGLRKIEKQAEGTTKELRQLQNALKVDPGNVDLIARQQDVYNRKLEVSKQKLEALRKIEREGKDMMSNEQWTSLQADIARTTQEITKYENAIKRTDLDQEMAKARDAVQNTNKELEILDRRLKLDPTNTELLAQKQQTLEKAIKASKEQLETFKKVQSEIGRENMTDSEWLELESQIVGCEEALEHYQDELKRTGNVSKESVGHMAETMSSVGDAIQEGSRKVANVGDTYTKTVSAGIVGAAIAGVKAAKDIDDAMTSVRKTVDGTAEEYDMLQEAAIEFSQTNAVSADTILELDALGAQLGFSIGELKEFGEVASGLDISSDMSAEQAATEMAQFANITKMAHSEIRNYASAIVALGNNMATTESKVSAMAQRVGAAGTQVGLSQQQILAWSGAMASLGIEAEAGGTAFSTMIKKVNLAVQTGSEDLEKFAEKAGMSAEEFAEAWKTNSNDAFIALLQGIANAEDMTVALSELDITAIRESDAMARLAGNTELVAQAQKLANDGWAQGTALGDEVANKNESLSSKLEILVNRLKAVAIEIGEPLVDALCDALDAAEPLFETVEEGAKAFSDLDKDEQQAIISTMGMIAAVGPLLSATGRIGGAVGSAMSALGNLGTDLKLYFSEAGQAARAAGKPIEGMTGALSSLKAGAIGVGVAAAGMLVAFGIEQWVKYQEEVERTAKAHRSLADLENEVANASSAAGDGVKTFAGIVIGAKSDLELMTETARNVKDTLADAGDGFVRGMKDINIDSGELNHYIDTIEELTAKEHLEEVEKGKLRVAVEKYNEITGDSIQIIDEETGKISSSTAALELNRDAWRQAAREKVYKEQIEEATRAIVEAEQQLPEANKILEEKAKKYHDLQVELAEHPMLYESINAQLEIAEKEYQEAQQDVDDLNNAMRDGNQVIDEMSKKMEQERDAINQTRDTVNQLTDRINNMGDRTREAMEKSGKSTSDLAVEFEAAGVKADDLAKVTDEDFARMWEECNGDVNKMIEKLGEYNGKPIEPKKAEIDQRDLDNALVKVGALKEALRNPIEQQIILSVKEKQYGTALNPAPNWTQHAEGGLFGSSLNTNAILSEPTLLGSDLFGEAGAEALISWRGGSAAIPLTNKKAVEPLAKTIAGFVAGGGNTEIHYDIYIDGTLWNNRTLTEQTVEDFITTVARKGDMNCG